MFTTDGEFEDEVRRIARLLWPAAEFGGARIIDDRERDGIFETSDLVNVIECTVSRSKVKAIEDTKKLEKLVKKLLPHVPDRKVLGWFVTLHEPTADQRNVVSATQGRVVACSFDQFRSKLVDARSYLTQRKKYPFGSVRDPETGQADYQPKYVPLDILDERGASYTLDQIAGSIQDGARVCLLGDYGAGRSATSRELFLQLARQSWENKSVRFPVLLNLRDHHGQTEPVEALERHARRIGFSPENSLVRAWRGGYVHLLLDGFDEVASAGWAGRTARLRDLRYRSMELLRAFVRETPSTAGVLMTGRAHFFDNQKELAVALGLAPGFLLLALNEFSSAQVATFLKNSRWHGVIPAWLPSRPLLLAYLMSRNLLSRTLESEVDLGPAVGWDELLKRITEREAEIEAGVEPESIRNLIEWLASLARTTIDGLGPLSADTIVEAFRDVCGYSPDDRGAVLLQRLPGLSTAQSEDGSRVFIDRDFAEAARAGMIVRFVEDPFNTKLRSETWQSSLRPLGLAVTAHRLTEAGGKPGRVLAALSHAYRGLKSATLSADLLLALVQAGWEYTGEGLYLSGVFVPELRLDDLGTNLSSVEFQDCVIGILEITPDLEATAVPVFRRCHFGSVEGRTGERDLPAGRFVDCDFDDFEITARTTAALLALSLPLSTRVLLTIVKKLYAQAGRGRKESALYRGLDQRAQSLIVGMLELLQREGFVTRTRQSGQTVWLPARGGPHRQRALSILAAPTASNDSVIVASRETE